MSPSLEKPALRLKDLVKRGATEEALHLLLTVDDWPADPNSRNVFGRTALHYLAERGRPLEEVELLLAAGADPNALDPFGYAPLHDAVMGDDAGIIQVLLDTGADPEARVVRGIHAGYTALEIARIERRETAVH